LKEAHQSYLSNLPTAKNAKMIYVSKNLRAGTVLKFNEKVIEKTRV